MKTPRYSGAHHAPGIFFALALVVMVIFSPRADGESSMQNVDASTSVAPLLSGSGEIVAGAAQEDNYSVHLLDTRSYTAWVEGEPDTPVVTDSGLAVFTEGPLMPAARMWHYSATLPDGRAALFGGHGTGFTALSTALFWTPGASDFELQNMNQVRSWPVFAKMADGRYLLAGGCRNLGIPAYNQSEIYDPVADTFTPSGTMQRFRSGSGGTVLADGQVLLAGAWWGHNTAHTYGELYQPEGGTFSEIGPFGVSRALAIVLPMADGSGVVLGGTREYGNHEDMPVERYNPETGEISTLQSMLFVDEPGWRASMNWTRPTFAHEMADGRYLWMASRTQDSVTSYRLFTFDPSNAAIEPLPLQGELPDSTTASPVEVLVDAGRSLAHVPVTVPLPSGQTGLEIITIHTGTGQMVRSSNHHVLGYWLFGMGMQVLEDGRLFITGGSSDATNFNPVQNTLLIVPPTLGMRSNLVVEGPDGSALEDGVSVMAFGNSIVNTQVTQTVTVRNVGTADLTGLAVTLGGAHASDFGVSSLGATTLAPGANTTFTVTFTPTVIGDREATLQITSNDADQNPFDIALAGTGVLYTLRYSAGSNGTVEGETEQVVAQGADGAPVQAVPNEGYIFAGWNDGSMANPRTDTNVTANLEVTALFELAPPPEESALEGVVTNALTGLPLPGVLVEVAGFSTTTDEEGYYWFENIPVAQLEADFDADVRSGEAPLTVNFRNLSTTDRHVLTGSLEGFLPYENTVELIPGETRNVSFSMSPQLNENEMRVVLNWGENPSDLDSHLVTPDVEGNTYHVYYDNPGVLDQAPYVQLDVDDTTSYGPETTTISRFFPGLYHYYIHLYEGDGTLATSEATVNFYGTDGLLRTVEVPTSGEGRYWHVATIDGMTGSIQLINQITDSASLPAPLVNGFAALAANNVDTNGVTYRWEFGDGATSAEVNPTHVYETAGAYTVTLTATQGGEVATRERTEYITVANPLPPVPQIVVKDSEEIVLDNGDSTLEFGDLTVGMTVSKSLTVHNTGTADLIDLSASLSGTDDADFSVAALESTTLAPGESTTVTVSFIPVGVGFRSATLEIASNDENENPFVISLGGTGLVPPAPEIVVEDSEGEELIDGRATLDFEETTVGESVRITITIGNIGTAPLTGLAVRSRGQHAADFILGKLATTSLEPGETTTFRVTFKPRVAGSRTAAIQIASNDADERPFDIALTGTGVEPLAPDIAVEQGRGVNKNLQDNRSKRDFGAIKVGKSSKGMVFTIKNTGTAPLTKVKITFEGKQAKHFILMKTPAQSVAPGKRTKFTVAYKPGRAKASRTTLQIASNDKTKNPFRVKLTGKGK